MDTDNNPSGTASLNMTADEAANMLSNMDFAGNDASQIDDETNETAAVDGSASDDFEIETTDEHPEADSDADEIEAEAGEADDEATDEAPEALFDDEAEIALGDEKIKFKELKAGYLRQSDYTKKTQALSEERATFSRQRDEVASSVRNSLMSEIKSYHDVLSQFTLPAPDQRLLDDNPAEFQRQKIAYDQQNIAINAFRQRHAQLAAQEQEAQAAAHKKLQASEVEKLFERIPDLDYRKGETQTKALRAFHEYGVANYGKEVMDNLADAQMTETLYKAYLWDMSQKQAAKVAPKIANSKPGMMTPGKKAPTSAEGERRKQMEQLKRTGSGELAADLISKYHL